MQYFLPKSKSSDQAKIHISTAITNVKNIPQHVDRQIKNLLQIDIHGPVQEYTWVHKKKNKTKFSEATVGKFY